MPAAPPHRLEVGVASPATAWCPDTVSKSVGTCSGSALAYDLYSLTAIGYYAPPNIAYPISSATASHARGSKLDLTGSVTVNVHKNKA